MACSYMRMCAWVDACGGHVLRAGCVLCTVYCIQSGEGMRSNLPPCIPACAGDHVRKRASAQACMYQVGPAARFRIAPPPPAAVGEGAAREVTPPQICGTPRRLP
jgi:hypothetical protein